MSILTKVFNWFYTTFMYTKYDKQIDDEIKVLTHYNKVLRQQIDSGAFKYRPFKRQ